MDPRIRRVLSLQLALLFGAVLTVYLGWGGAEAVAAGFGVAVTAANTGLMAWRMRKPANLTQPGLGEFYRSWLERYLLVGALLALGLGGLKLLPLWLLTGFILGQMVWIFAPLFKEAGARDTEET